ncbi:hypothetical protein SEI61121_18418 [Salmonella enterica subsp. indica serovar 6,14,25:z10:1,(2),7 str. 1121]|uniref:Uncharacterized protein n=1 Tax=Salmonella enterica subsp. indica serovar 6,14,25:z10:1,(2),7 str. 1121 TaxID=1173950 RepID=V1GP46_SALER|nr:hypothetical protein SEI61121_18418 [Salmonella enterica subsp. indica serovar 6,14,25:z10:1,(2),7 str. 1121]
MANKQIRQMGTLLLYSIKKRFGKKHTNMYKSGVSEESQRTGNLKYDSYINLTISRLHTGVHKNANR